MADRFASNEREGRIPIQEEVEESPRRNASQSPTAHDVPLASSSLDEPKDDALELSRTKSIAETLSLPHEIAFIATVCSAQLLTRESQRDISRSSL